MPLTKLQFRPGVNREYTSYSNEGGWYDGDKIRFHLGYPEKIGGWQKYSNNSFIGTARRLHNWVAIDGSNFMGVGTTVKYYIEEGEAFFDITPIRITTAAGAVTFSATNGSTTITVTDIAHGAVAGDFVTFSGAASLGGSISAVVLNAEYQIDTVIDSNTYTITTIIPANASDTGNGGASVVGSYQINTGLNTTVGGTGWGAGLYGGRTLGGLQTIVNEGGTFSAVDTTLTVLNASPFPSTGTILIDRELITYSGKSGNDLTGLTRGVNGTSADSHANASTVFLAVGNSDPNLDFTGWGSSAAGGIIPVSELRLWSHDNFGEDLIINPRDGGIYYWDKTNSLASRAVEIGTLGGASNTPIIAKQVLVSDLDRHVIAFGCNAQGGTDQDNLLIRFSDQESITDWTATATNTAGDLRLGSGSTFVQAVETKREVLVWTDKSLHSLRFIGPPFTFGLQQLASNITIMGPKAAVATEDYVFWMGIDNFYVYAGQTTQLPCTVRDYVFTDFNKEQAEKVVSGVNSQWGEVVWFYPSASSEENDRYVIYNYLEKVWYYGTLSRSAWLDRGIRQYPIAAGGNYLYNHEIGQDDDGAAMESFIESSQMDVGDGERFTFLKRIIPDVKFEGSTAINPAVDFTIKARNYPGGNYLQTDTKTATRTATAPVEQFTENLDIRARGRSFAFRLDSSGSGVRWKLGSPRVDIRQDGRR